MRTPNELNKIICDSIKKVSLNSKSSQLVRRELRQYESDFKFLNNDLLLSSFYSACIVVKVSNLLNCLYKCNSFLLDMRIEKDGDFSIERRMQKARFKSF